MRRLPALAVLVVLAALAWFLLGSREEHASPAPAVEPAPVAAIAPADAMDAAQIAESGTRAAAEPAAVRVEEAPAATAAKSDAARCVVIGRLLDADGAPIAGAQVRLYAYKGWAEGIDVPRLSGRLDLRGFEVATSETGAFRVEAPVPTAPRPVLEIRPDRFHDSVTLYFGATGDRVLPPLVAGERDVGDLRVVRTGALRGRVLDAQGAPIADVQMTVGPTPTQTFGRDARTEADGSYVIAHAPPGTYGVKAKSERHLAHFEPGVVVEVGRDTQVADIVLASSPTIEGRVVDENGRPVAGAKLYGWPVSEGGGFGAGATSDADGRFVVYLPQLDPYTLSAKLDGYVAWGGEHDRSVTFEGGRRDVEVVLRSMPRTRFVVVDAETGAPIERFGVDVLADNGSLAKRHVYTERRPPTQSVHTDGAAEATARVGLDLYVIAADGYVLATGDVAHDVEGVSSQTVRMQRGVALRARVLRQGAPLADAAVELVVILTHQRGADGKPDLERPLVDANTRRTTRTDRDGRFEIAALEQAEFRLTVKPPKGAPLVRAPVHLEPRGTTDLGDLVVEAGATIAGELLVPFGIDPASCSVRLDDRDGPAALVDGAGRFRFEDVSSGVHHLTHESRGESLARGEAVRVELAPGETKSVVLDARDRAKCDVELRIDLGDVPAKGLRVNVGDDARGTDGYIGVCDASGRVRGSVRASGSARVFVSLPDGRTLRHPDVVLDLAPLGRVEADVRFALARLDLKLPVPLPRDGYVHVVIAPAAEGELEQFARLRFANGAPVGDCAAMRAIEGGVSVGALYPGAHTLVVEVSRTEPRPAGSPFDPGDAVVDHHATANVVLVAGRTLELAP